jgi:outer membrane protein TolC
MTPPKRITPVLRSILAATVVITATSACASPESHATTRHPTSTTNHQALGVARELDLRRPLEPQELACAVLTVNPSIAAWYARWSAASQAPDEVTSLGNTELSYGFSPLSIGSSQTDFGQIVTLRQSFELGQSELERRVLTHRAEALEFGIEAQRNELARISASLAAEYYAIARALETNREHEQLAREALEIATAHYASGHGTQQDPILADLELAHVEHERIVLESQRRIVRAQINGLLHRAPQAELPGAPDELSVVSDASEPTAAEHPERGAARARLAAGDDAIELARRRRNPSINASATYNSMLHTQQHRMMLGVGVSIPLQLGSLRAGVQRAQHEREALDYELQALDDQLAVEVATARERLTEARHIVKIHAQRLIPGARDRLEAARVAYESDEGRLSDVISAERELRGLELHLHRAHADLLHRQADLEFALGVRMDCGSPAAPKEVDHG